MRFVSQQILRPGCEGVIEHTRRDRGRLAGLSSQGLLTLKVHLDGAGENMGRFGGNAEVTRGGEMGIFGKVYVTRNGTCTSPLVIFGSSLFSKSLKTNGAVVTELADAPA